MIKYPRLRLRGVPGVRAARVDDPWRPKRQLLAREVFRIAFYMPHDHPDIAAGVGHAIDSYVRAVGQGPKAIHDLSISHEESSTLTPEQWRRARRLLENTKRWSYPEDYDAQEQRAIEKRGFECGLLFTGGFGIHNGFEFDYMARIPWRPEPEEQFVSLLTVTVPVEYLEEHGPARLRQLTLDMASQLKFASGHAGLALRHYGWLPRTDEAFRLEPLRYPGIDLRTAWGRADTMGHWVDGVHWLNFLGPPTLARLGGATALRSRLRTPETTLVELDSERVVVSLGEQPEAGDLTMGHDLPAYREFAQVMESWLEPLPAPSRPEPEADLRYSSLRLTANEARRWWRRFLE